MLKPFKCTQCGLVLGVAWHIVESAFCGIICADTYQRGRRKLKYTI